jgi:DNA mismatch repair protein MutL
MQDIIRLLPDSIANQIAAGEVVQRPASAVKELLENSIDAGATSIHLIVKEAGKTHIQVIDNGQGMSVTDARMSFERHATSKISSFDDLLQLRTKGFRGEALASIAAVAQVEMKTKREQDELGTLLRVEASEVKLQEPFAGPVGTSITVRNLFYNVPARRNFLKSNPIELRHITDEFFRVALAHPNIAFQFTHNDLDMFQLDAGKLSKRIVQLFGKNYQHQLIPCQEETDHVRITGYIGKPEFSRKTRGEQFFFVNDRFIKNSYLNHAVVRGYEGLVKDEFFPFYVLNIEMDPADVDVNVHPTKTEVKFADDRTLYGVIHSAVRQALASHNVTPSLDFSTDINFTTFADRKPVDVLTGREKAYTQFRTVEQPSARQLEAWDRLYRGVDAEVQREIEQASKEYVPGEKTAPANWTPSEQVEKNFSLHDLYLLRPVKSGMMVLDKEAALERIHYEQLKNTPSGASQSSMFPQEVRLNAADYSLALEMKTELNTLGFEFEPLSKELIVIQGVPADLVPCNEKEVFEGLLEQFKQNARILELPQAENLKRSLARRMAVMRSKKLTAQETDHLIDRLFGCEQPNFTPAGKPTYVLISLEKINSWFNK